MAESYEVIAGKYCYMGLNERGEKDLITVGKGVIVQSDDDLEKKFINKFRKVRPELLPLSEKDIKERSVEFDKMCTAGAMTADDRDFVLGLNPKQFTHLCGKMGWPKESPVGEKSPLGDDVTANFPTAVAAGLKVFTNPAGKHQVSKDGKVALNPKALKPAEVEKFVETQQKEG